MLRPNKIDSSEPGTPMARITLKEVVIQNTDGVYPKRMTLKLKTNPSRIDVDGPELVGEELQAVRELLDYFAKSYNSLAAFVELITAVEGYVPYEVSSEMYKDTERNRKRGIVGKAEKSVLTFKWPEAIFWSTLRTQVARIQNPN